MDPLETVVMEKDTSFILMWEAHRRGHQVFFLTDGGMTFQNGQLNFQTVEVIPEKNSGNPFPRRKPAPLNESQVDALFIRSDPPFDSQYLLNTWLLDRLSHGIPMINHPSGIRTVNEKIWATRFKSIVPRTLIGRNRQDILNFFKEEKDVIVKPTDGFGGSSVFHVHQEDKNARVILETMTMRWTKEIIVQQYIPEAQNGDKRILLLNGDPLGAVLRLHAQDDHRNNFFAGGKSLPTTINQRDQEIIAILKPELQKLGLYFVGIDVIGGHLIEVNVTSPTCLQEMNQLYKQNLETEVIDFAEKLIGQYRAGNKI